MVLPGSIVKADDSVYRADDPQYNADGYYIGPQPGIQQGHWRRHLVPPR